MRWMLRSETSLASRPKFRSWLGLMAKILASALASAYTSATNFWPWFWSCLASRSNFWFNLGLDTTILPQGRNFGLSLITLPSASATISNFWPWTCQNFGLAWPRQQTFGLAWAWGQTFGLSWPQGQHFSLGLSLKHLAWFMLLLSINTIIYVCAGQFVYTVSQIHICDDWCICFNSRAVMFGTATRIWMS